MPDRLLIFHEHNTSYIYHLLTYSISRACRGASRKMADKPVIQAGSPYKQQNPVTPRIFAYSPSHS